LRTTGKNAAPLNLHFYVAHPFHLFNVQVANRVGWDGMIKPPESNELSWKDTVRMNPLEDVIVALRPAKMNVPFHVPNSMRSLDVTMLPDMTSAMMFTNVDPTNQSAAVTNGLVNFGWEYVWHCHLLGHEENEHDASHDPGGRARRSCAISRGGW